MKKYKHYSLLADMFRYPGQDFPEVLNVSMEVLRDGYPEAATELGSFVNYTLDRTIDDWEELYTKTFDVQPICYLDLGYVIFGEDYKRGAFLLHMQGEQQKVNNDCGTDLPDNLCNILTLFDKTDDEDFVDELAVKILIPGVKKMIHEFSQARIDLKTNALKKLHRAIIQEELNVGNVYRNMFSALLMVLEKDFKGIHYEKPQETIVNMQHHQSFFSKKSLNTGVQKMADRAELNTIINNYKLD